MSDIPKVSILVPVFNVERFVAEAIDSIKNQSYRNWEAVIVDDGSTDSTLAVVQSSIINDPRFILVVNPKNLGLVDSLNVGLKYCSGDYIARFDGDDIMLPSKLEIQADFLDKNPDVSLVGSDVFTISETGVQLGISRFFTSDKFIKKALNFYNPMLHCWMARRNFYSDLCGYRHVIAAEDYDILARGSLVGFIYSSVPMPLISIRKRLNNTADTLSASQVGSMIFIQEMLRSGCLRDVSSSDIVTSDDVSDAYFRAAKNANLLIQERGLRRFNYIFPIFGSSFFLKNILIRRLAKFLVYFERFF